MRQTGPENLNAGGPAVCKKCRLSKRCGTMAMPLPSFARRLGLPRSSRAQRSEAAGRGDARNPEWDQGPQHEPGKWLLQHRFVRPGGIHMAHRHGIDGVSIQQLLAGLGIRAARPTKNIAGHIRAILPTILVTYADGAGGVLADVPDFPGLGAVGIGGFRLDDAALGGIPEVGLQIRPGLAPDDAGGCEAGQQEHEAEQASEDPACLHRHPARFFHLMIHDGHIYLVRGKFQGANCLNSALDPRRSAVNLSQP